MSLAASGSTAAAEPTQQVGAKAQRVALVLPRDPAGADAQDPSVYWSSRGFESRTKVWENKVAETFVIDGPKSVAERRAREVVDGDFDLVVVAGDGVGARALAPLVRSATSTRFAFVGPRLADLGLAHVPNASGYAFAEQEMAQLAGYLSALVPPRGQPHQRAPDMVSVVTGSRTPGLDRVVAGFRKGVRRASADVRIRVAHVRDANDRTACEAVANRQIDAGSDVVLALGGTCGSAALAVVRVRGVWGIRDEDERIQPGEHILGTLSKYWEMSVGRPVNDIELGGLPEGKDVELGLADDYAVLFTADDQAHVPEALWSKVVKLCSTIRSHTVKNI